MSIVTYSEFCDLLGYKAGRYGSMFGWTFDISDEKKKGNDDMPYRDINNLFLNSDCCITNVPSITTSTATITGNPVGTLAISDQLIEYFMGKKIWFHDIPEVVRVDVYNNKVVKVTFADGSFTKCVCSDNDHFDLDVGITICILKRALGKNADDSNRAYNNLMRGIHKTMDKREKELKKQAEEKKARRDKQRKAEMKNAAIKLKKKEEFIDSIKQGFLRANQELDKDTI